MYPKEDVRTHADRILAMEEIQRLAGELRRAADRKTAAINEAHVRIVNLAGELMELLYIDAEFLGVDEKRLARELRVRRLSSPFQDLKDEAVTPRWSHGTKTCARAGQV